MSEISEMSEVLYEGKSKVLLAGPDEDSIIIRHKDVATANDGAKKGEFPGKGKLNSAISNLIYDYLAENGVKTHMIKVIDEVTVLAKKAEIVLVEVIVRNVAAGSFSRRFGVPEGSALNNVAYEFSLKSDELGDPMINNSQITAIGLATEEELAEMAAMALRINDLLVDLFLKVGIRLIDFKVEFGRSKDGIILCDEITPDSCRLWDAETEQKLDKDVFRRDLGDLLEGYRDVYARLTNVLGK